MYATFRSVPLADLISVCDYRAIIVPLSLFVFVRACRARPDASHPLLALALLRRHKKKFFGAYTNVVPLVPPTKV